MLELRDVYKYYSVGRGWVFGREKVKAVDGVSLAVAGGETLGLVGESGCGKSTLGRVALLLERPDSGRVFFDGRELTRLSGSQLRMHRKNMQIVFQDSLSSFNTRFTVEEIVSEPLLNYEKLNKETARERVKEILQAVELEETFLDRYPGELSGGQRQRVGIARALVLNPRLIILDEPLSSLDVSVQAQILNLLKKLKLSYGLAYLFISHDLRAVEYLSDRIAVMYRGRVVEILPKRSINMPVHPYSRLLLSSVPVKHPRFRTNQNIYETKKGEDENSRFPADWQDPGCAFRFRCPHVIEKCSEEKPELLHINREQQVACFNISVGRRVVNGAD
ncbi:oligopeptide/dipeptide ABC transporter ATP-binding protein [Thermincola potens]|uniref:Oligopeptide/dipeptide ABC transporter, ATPase subunit n=1 Tax=Thermincola potens (strain JR) TaxID=635013 RepID=D5XEM7_THEPJ|nr:oligopeptide/dipeptide ABC transporter ATP-binding protein [Thermincola potens]ADG82098.1 oligopeptide/dipeptide ABC transporter, ATPase subunit [Thermincola potens JR]